jgi:hypothetical protein
MFKLIGNCQKEHDDIIVLCDCGESDHHLRLSRWKDEKLGRKEIFVSLVKIYPSFWYRIKWAWDFIWYGPHHDEIILSPEQIGDLCETLNELYFEIVKENYSESIGNTVSKM